MNRTELLDRIAQASLTGYLGFFVGSGFSRVVSGALALTFRGLLDRLIVDLDLELDLEQDEAFRHRSFPQAASLLLEHYRENADIDDPDLRFRERIAQLCNFQPAPETRARYSTALSDLRPSWVITTNYDLVMETLLPGAESVLPDRPLVSRPDRVPIYHLHGHRLRPSTIKITEEDYASLLGPIDYQRLKLPLLLLESTTVMIGYSLGDMNVRAAMEWSSSFRTGIAALRLDSHEGLVVQALFVGNREPNPEPYQGPSGAWVVEVDDIVGFLEEMGAIRFRRLEEQSRVQEEIRCFLGGEGNAAAVADATSVPRQRFLAILEEAMRIDAAQVETFLDAALEPIWDRAWAPGGFPFYDQYLRLLLDILTRTRVEVGPSILAFLADHLDRVANYIEPERPRAGGVAWDATRTWLGRRDEIPTPVLQELRSFAEAYGRWQLVRLLDF